MPVPTDTDHCKNISNSSLRQSRVALWRIYDDTKIPSVLLSQQSFPGINPLCEKVPPLFTADFQSIHFECRYYGSSAH
jgi:hypothetical protein